MREVLLVLVVSAAACAAGDGSGRCGPSSAVVTQVIDGDTIGLEGGQRVRYLLVDTNEITGGKDECYGHEAMQHNADMVLGKTVDLTYDVECTDAYDRLLAYVSVGGRDVNLDLVQKGYACVLYIPPDGETRHEEFETAVALAEAQGVGMWGACDPVPCTQ
jgi:micrococcal nuclease